VPSFRDMAPCHASGTRGSVHSKSQRASRGDRFTQPWLRGVPKLLCQYAAWSVERVTFSEVLNVRDVAQVELVAGLFALHAGRHVLRMNEKLALHPSRDWFLDLADRPHRWKRAGCDGATTRIGAPSQPATPCVMPP
jgi:hypothetical protein